MHLVGIIDMNLALIYFVCLYVRVLWVARWVKHSYVHE